MVNAKEYVDRKARGMLEVMRFQTILTSAEEPENWNFKHIQYNIFGESKKLEGFCRLAQRVGINCEEYLQEARELRQPYLKFWARVA